ncbi:MAG: helix-turn-helix domain-containing protein, partial [Clostridia bacterium]|nr:helix-turn-helix domain-containing protein [Clostridia bacterium]
MNPIRTGQFIRIRRKRLGLSLSKLAEMLCVEPQTVSKWERGLGMPDYDNVDKLRSIFGCSLTDILEPDPAELGEEETEKAEENETPPMLLPALVPFIQESDCDGEAQQDKGRRKKSFRFFDFLNKRKIKETLEKTFGYEYANTYNEKFLFRGLFGKHSREECEETLTQGMFRDKVGHSVIGIEAPWLYFRLFLFLLLCTGVALPLALLGSPMPFVLTGGLLSALPLMMFLFESNFTRNVSIIDVLRIFAIGGLLSILTALLMPTIPIENDFLQVAIIAPVTEEIAKALLVVIFV